MILEGECRTLIGAAIDVHRALGPGLLESVYVKCLALELQECGLTARCEVPIPILSKGRRIEPAYRADIVVNDAIIVEVKSATRLEAVHKAQLLTYLRLTGLRVGFLLNFNNEYLKQGITRVVL